VLHPDELITLSMNIGIVQIHPSRLNRN